MLLNYNYSSFTATKSGIVLLFLQYASWIELLLGGGVARGRSFYSAAVTWYKSDIPLTPTRGYAPIYPLLPWLLRGVAKGYVTTGAEDSS